MTLETVPLESVAEVRLGRQRSPQHHSGEQMRPYVRAANVGWDGWQLDDVKSMNFTDAEMNVYRLQQDDLLLGEASGSAREVGKPAIWEGQLEDCAFQNTLIRVRPRDVDARYLLHYFKHAASSGKFAERSRGVGIFHLGRQALAEWPLPLPSGEEQRRIAAILDAADALRAKRRQALAKLDTLTGAIFIEMFGDPIHNERGWRCLRIGDICRRVQIGPFGSLLHQSDYVEGGIPLVNPMHIIDGRIRPEDHQTVSPAKHKLLRTYWLEPDDVVMGRRGEMGRVAIVAEAEAGFLCGSGSLFLRLDEGQAVPGYVAAVLSSAPGRRRLERAAQGVTMLNLNSDIVGNLEVAVPSIALQREFVGRVSQVDALHSLQISDARRLDSLFASLQQRAFRGDL